MVLPCSEDYDVRLKLGAIYKSEAILCEALDRGTVLDFNVSVDNVLARSNVWKVLKDMLVLWERQTYRCKIHHRAHRTRAKPPYHVSQGSS